MTGRGPGASVWVVPETGYLTEGEVMNDHDKKIVKLADSVEQIHLIIPAQPATSEERLSDRLTAGCECIVACREE